MQLAPPATHKVRRACVNVPLASWCKVLANAEMSSALKEHTAIPNEACVLFSATLMRLQISFASAEPASASWDKPVTLQLAHAYRCARLGGRFLNRALVGIILVQQEIFAPQPQINAGKPLPECQSSVPSSTACKCGSVECPIGQYCRLAPNECLAKCPGTLNL